MSDPEKAVTAHLRHIDFEGKSDRTVYERGLLLKRVTRAIGKPLLEATPEDLYEWRASLDKLNPATVACYASGVIMFYRWAVKKGLIDRNPADDLPVPPMPHRDPHPISPADLAHAINTSSAKVRIWLVLAAWCGLRAKEISRLRAECIRLRDETPHLRITHTATKGHKERIIPLHAFVISELGRADLYPSGLVFRKADGHPLRPWTVSKICNEHLHSQGIPDSLHSLRHWFGTRAFEVDRDLKAAQKLLGHAHIQTTAGYAAIDGAALARTVNGIPSPLSVLRNQEAS